VSTYRVTFERIGRTHDVPELTTTAVDLDELAEAVHDYARRFLVSNDYEVSVRGADDVDVTDKGKVYIGWGRYGTGTFEEVA
jgi:hypothetical protein